MFYYQDIQLTVAVSGIYNFRSDSSVDTYGYLYSYKFDPSNISVNMIAQDDDSGGSPQTDTIYVLVVTTFLPNITRAFSIVGSGPGKVNFIRNTASIISSTTATSTNPISSNTNTTILWNIVTSSSTRPSQSVAGECK
jgi:hypothetical protein